MNKRSKVWEQEKSKLDLREEELKNELELVSDNLGENIRRVAKIALISGGIFFVSYGLYKLFSSSAKKESADTSSGEKQQAPVPVKVKSDFSLKKMITERIALVIMKFIGAQLSLLISKKLEPEKEGETEND